MSLIQFRTFFNHRAQPAVPDEPDYPRLITDNLTYIERQCFKAVSNRDCRFRDDYGFTNDAQQENDANELFIEVIDHLKAGDFSALRKFKGSSKITTYISAIISNLFMNIVRERKGRSRAKERASSMGTLGVQLHNLDVLGYTLQDAHGHLVISHGISEDIDELRGMLENIRGKNAGKIETDVPYFGKEVVVDGEVEVIVEDPGGNAEKLLDDAQREQNCNLMLDELLEGLDNEDRLILRMRFPAKDDVEGKSIRDIAAILCQTEKAVDSRIRRILLRCREKLMSKGLSLDDLIPARK